MKKTLLATAIALSAMVNANAQEAFKALGASFELGTTGVGVNFTMPVVTDHLFVSLGMNFPNYTYNGDFDIRTELNSNINTLNQNIDQMKSNPATQGIPEVQALNKLNNQGFNDKITVDGTAKLKMTNFKLMLEYYPSVNSTFHVTGGMFIGSGDLLEINGTADKTSWNLLQQGITLNNQIKNLENKYPQQVHGMSVKDFEGSLSYNIDGQTVFIDPSNNQANAKIAINNVKPYIGIGFGRAIPMKHRLGFQFEIGCWFHGKPKLEGANVMSEDESRIWAMSHSVDSDKDIDDVAKTIKKISVYPQITFRLTGRIFNFGNKD